MIERFEGSIPGGLSKSSPIQLEVPQVRTTPLKTLVEIALAIEARSPIANDPAIGEASIARSSVSSLQEEQGLKAMRFTNKRVPAGMWNPATMQSSVASRGGLSGVAGYNRNVSLTMAYKTIRLSCCPIKKDVEKQQKKIVNDPEQDGNVDTWLDKDFSLEMDEVLARFREGYVTILGSNAKTLSP
ncbi:hypothetical protein AgCh_038776 [Apium graveolens]